MKKIMMLLASMFVFTAVYAQGPTCRLYDANNIVATITQPKRNTGNSSTLNGIDVELTQEHNSDISIVVEALDPEGNVGGTTIITIPAGRKERSGAITDLKHDTSYTLRIARASCQ
ncbi:MAG: hypothetical protein E7148_06210 [Rikenellaceae bacterium]|nr:hypothetical protein [Rikenellaceae bacterium]